MYDQFDSIAAAKTAYRRCRTTKHFILSDAGAAKLDPVCVCCGKKLSEDTSPDGYRGNRCRWSPKTKKVAVMHYTCAWGNIMAVIHGTGAKLI